MKDCGSGTDCHPIEGDVPHGFGSRMGVLSMNDSRLGGEKPFRTVHFLSFIAAVWTIGIVCSLTWNITRMKEQSVQLAVVQARASFEKDLVYRRWILHHGGVYVPVSKETPPNPNLAHIPERDIDTPSGKHLTLMNSSYMIRQAHEIAKAQGGVLARITSLRPMNPGNGADEWETAALKNAEEGRGEVSGLEELDGREYMRLIRPLVVEDSCLTCHPAQDAKWGEIMGAISISVPMEPFRSAERNNVLTLMTAHGLLWLFGIGGIVHAAQRIEKGEARRRRAEETLRESEERYRSLVESSPEAIAVHDGGKYLYINSAGAGLLGASDPSELIGRSVTDFLTPGGAPNLEESAPDGVTPPVERKLVRLDGREIDIEEVEMRIHYLGSPAVQVLMRDVTERRRMEEERAKMETQLRQAQKVEAIATLAGGVAHDFNNILSAIFGYTEIALMALPAEAPVRNHLQQVLKAGHRAKDLVRQILTYSRHCGDEEKTAVEIGPIVKETVKFLRASLPSTIEIRRDIAEGSHIALATPTQMHQVLLNLCTNALHAMEEKGGVLGISLAQIQLNGNGARDFPDLKPGPYLKLAVSDTGGGMDPLTVERIFDPYFTTKEVGKGSGLGLAVVHGIVKHCEGSINVKSQRGVGSTFTVLLPMIRKIVPPSREVDRALCNGNERILLVDDEMDLVESGKKMLSQMGYRVTSLSSSREALRIFTKTPDAFDLLITDYTMPAMTGEELARAVHAVRGDIPVILTSGFSERITEEKMESLGIARYILKPLTMLEMSQNVRIVLDEAQRKQADGR